MELDRAGGLLRVTRFARVLSRVKDSESEPRWAGVFKLWVGLARWPLL